ncbi:hypothetical protein DPEC_G00300460 [Dallia pectoralis]|uniref:Uncharacterized protein n=1 Tax=Dallia pectoralis TaxID=75939 RepID=A0ACC2FGN4_DALPE|nr:hypothetical protein DPEC_G00300460 [Dallia pectoralis]
MSMITTATFLSAALLLLVPGILSLATAKKDQIHLKIYNSISHGPNVTYTLDIAFRGILLGAMNNLQKDDRLRFSYTEDPNYGPFLVRVNGLAGNNTEHTYWQLLVKRGKTIIIPDVGIGCFIPKPGDTVILKFTKW